MMKQLQLSCMLCLHVPPVMLVSVSLLLYAVDKSSDRPSKYCQLIRAENRWKQFQWAIENLDEVLTDGFDDVIWTDEITSTGEPSKGFIHEKGTTWSIEAMPKTSH